MQPTRAARARAPRPEPDADARRELYSLAQIQHLARVEFHRAQRYGYPIACLTLRVDRLGHLRDTLGYEAKESVLQDVIELLLAETRISDFIGRLPDDRLLIVVPHARPDQAETVARRLLEKVRALSTEGVGGDLALSLSIGCSHAAAGATPFHDELLRVAERALAEAVAAGGDRYVSRGVGGGAL